MARRSSGDLWSAICGHAAEATTGLACGAYAVSCGEGWQIIGTSAMSHNDPKSVSQRGWGVELHGHPHDLADWEQALKLPFDPWVHRQEDEFVLRWSGFSGLQTVNEVRQSAAMLMDELNGAMAVVHSTRPVRSKGITEFRSDGGRNKFAEIEEFRVRGRAVAEGVALGPDGQVRPPPPPQQSEVQQWLALGEKQQALA
jgi:hypothetical protein